MAVTVNLRDGSAAVSGTCVATDPVAWLGYAVLAGVPPDNLAGAGFLVDPNGWLRGVRFPGAASGWDAGESLIAAIRRIYVNPVREPSGGQHEHHP